jgi:phosphodiesterase/alkaline phosphatase D-like protein
MTVVKPAAAPTETARAESPSRVASKPPMMTIGTKAAPESTEAARSESPSPVASEQSASGTIAAAESTEPVPAAAKKTHTKRKTVRHERPSREFWNPMNFFAWGSSNGARRAF